MCFAEGNDAWKSHDKILSEFQMTRFWSDQVKESETRSHDDSTLESDALLVPVPGQRHPSLPRDERHPDDVRRLFLRKVGIVTLNPESRCLKPVRKDVAAKVPIGEEDVFRRRLRN